MKRVTVPEDQLQLAEERIDWVLAHPAMNVWLKDSLRTARNRPPVELMNDLEVLNVLLQGRCRAMIDSAIPCSADSVKRRKMGRRI